MQNQGPIQNQPYRPPVQNFRAPTPPPPQQDGDSEIKAMLAQLLQGQKTQETVLHSLKMDQEEVKILQAGHFTDDGKGAKLQRQRVVNEEAEEVYVPPPPRPPPIPFPSHLKKHNEDRQFARFAEMLKKLEITMPFTEAILQMPSYTKFLKDILTNKRVVEKETVSLNTECNAALCDLGASVSLLPLSIFKKLNVGELKPTSMALQLADRSVKYPAGILEDVPLKVGNFYVPVDFMVLDMDEDSRVPIILGRPFLNTADAVIHVRAGRLTMKIGEEIVEFTLDQNLKKTLCDGVFVLH
ncbi:PREDICTED: uncharacterized protein LOC104818551 [Tarenaya hassleriana]|uniref:uncharacterized protein LOC104818551 n=1 Tax=Tarenaya hassleriana TaxID=28532 RepID=UPI00053C9744|nr:PREDICTED: uncharacterized protein LOC104818551 [Tarenaya hassleriana]